VRAAERAVVHGRHATTPFILVAQPTRFDASRAPAGNHTLWAYAHVPAGSRRDYSEPLVSAIEHYAPGFRDTIRMIRTKSAVDMEAHNPNYVHGDIATGATTLRQLVRRPILSTNPWATPLEGTYICSAATPPGPGVHGLSGWHAARRALRDVFGTAPPYLGID
jgi:phytoene dehydrogenase-like protein